MTPYEDQKLKRMAEKKRMEDLGIPIISQELAKSYSANSKKVGGSKYSNSLP